MSELPIWLEVGLAFTAFLQFLLLVFIVPLRGAIDRLKEADDRLSERLNGWQVEVAKEYVRRDEITAQHREVLAAIQRVESKISALEREKADK